MDENKTEITPEESTPEQQTETNTPRPAWQVWLARVALVLFIIIVIGQILRIARGGL